MKNTSGATVITLPFQNAKGAIENRAQFSLPEVNELTGVPVSQLRKLCHNGVLNPITGFGRKFYISAEDLLQLQNQRLRIAKEAA